MHAFYNKLTRRLQLSFKNFVVVLLVGCFFYLVSLLFLNATQIYGESLTILSMGESFQEGFEENAYYPKIEAPRIKDPGIVLYGTWIQGNQDLGKWISPWYEAKGNGISMLVTGYPTREGMSLYVETKGNSGQETTKIEYQAGDPRETWSPWTVALTPGSQFRVVAIDATADAPGWMGVSTPYRGSLIDYIAEDIHVLLGLPVAFLCFLIFLLPGLIIYETLVPAKVREQLRAFTLSLVFTASSAVALLLFLLFYYNFSAAQRVSCAIFAASLAIFIIFRKKFTPVIELPQFKNPLILVFFLGALYTGVLFITHPQNMGFYRFSQYLYSLPPDGIIPYLVAEKFRSGGPLQPFLGEWLTSDRPPLATCIYMMVDSISILSKTDLYQLFGTFVELSWVAAVFNFASFLDFGKRKSRLLLLFTAFCGTFYINSVFLWPKFLTVVFFSIVFILYHDLYQQREFNLESCTKAIIVGGCAALACLSHGGIVFAFVGLLLVLLPKLRMNIKLMLTGLASFAVMYTPWLFYQKVIDPPGDRLLKYQLAGFKALTPRPALEVIIESYTQVPFSTILRNKLGSLKFHVPPVLQPFGYNAMDNRGDEFFHLFALVGIAWIALFWLFKRDSLKDIIKPKNRYAIITLLFSILSTSLLLYNSVTIHVSPYSNLVLLAVLIVMVASYSPNVVCWIILAYQIVTFFDKYLRVLPTVFVARTSLPSMVVCAVFALFTFCFIVHITKCEENSLRADFTKFAAFMKKNHG